MKRISDADYAKTLRLLKAYSRRKGESLREEENIRQARLLVRKWEKRQTATAVHDNNTNAGPQ